MKELYIEAENNIRDMIYELLEPQFGDHVATNISNKMDIPYSLIEEKAIDQYTDMIDRNE